MMMGKLGHYGLEVFYKSHGEPNAQRIEKVAMAIRQESMSYTTLDGAEKQTVFDAVRDYIIHHMGESWVPIEVEKPFSKVLYVKNDLTVILEGKMDLVYHQLGDNTIRFADHKFVWQKWPISELNNQFMAYAFAVDSKIGMHNAIYLYKKGAEFVRTTLSFDREQLEEWQNKTVPYWIDLLMKAYEDKYFAMNFQFCDKFGGCMYQSLCKVPSSIRNSIIGTDYVKYEGEDLYD